ncbi:MAG TPA: glycerophosphodiester phosphodiesterase [Capillimicrobium sp.]|nr:glycerophosphodiester phosphodiesterase [Capillimicrobium sp.]
MLRPVVLAIATLLATAASASAALPVIHAHRGGTHVWGKATFAEEALPTYVAAAKAGDVLEMDVQMTLDNVPLVIHDTKLDRVTPCTGLVASYTANDIRTMCPIDVLGSPRSSLGGRKNPERHVIPTLEEVLRVARKYDVEVNIELKPFDETGEASRIVALTIINSGLPMDHVIIQSFHIVSLQSAQSLMPGVKTSMLTIARENQYAIERALSVGATYVSPKWPVDAAFVGAAHAAGLLVAPWTINDPFSAAAARDLGVDAIISDDPVMAYWTLRR